MNKTEFVTYLIQHAEDYPENKPLDLDSAARLISLLDSGHPDLTPQELMDEWNRLITDPSVMEE